MRVKFFLPAFSRIPRRLYVTNMFGGRIRVDDITLRSRVADGVVDNLSELHLSGTTIMGYIFPKLVQKLILGKKVL